MPNWLNEALLRRYDEISELADRLEDVLQIKRETEVRMGELEEALPEQRRELARAWQDAHDQQSAIQQQWSYITGVRDGVELITSLLALEPLASYNGRTPSCSQGSTAHGKTSC